VFSSSSVGGGYPAIERETLIPFLSRPFNTHTPIQCIQQHAE
jgi:hypothetical protein